MAKEPFIIPLVDFGAFLHGSEAERTQAARQLVKSFEVHGFVRLGNHGISKEFVNEIWRWSNLFFNLKEEEKAKISHFPGPEPQRGWSQLGLETTSRLRKENKEHAPKDKGELLDEKEHFDCGPPGDQEFPNVYPSEEALPGFQAFIEDYYELAQRLSLDVMRACEVGFNMPKDALVGRCQPAASELRLLHYPPVSVERLNNGTIKRAWPHTDFGIITLLFQDGLGGLECEDRRFPYTFQSIIASDDYELIVNTSDTLTRWTNGYISAGLHQVSVPPNLKTQRDGFIPERYSSVFFFKAHRDISVGPISHFVTDERPAKFEDITALQFHREMTQITY